MIVSISEIIKGEGLDVLSESLPDNVMGEVRNDALVYNKAHKSKADIKVIMACLLVLHRHGIRGYLDGLFRHDSRFIGDMLQEAVDIVLPQELFASGQPIYYKQHNIKMDTINLQRQRWKDIEEPKPVDNSQPIDQFIDDDIEEFL